MNYTKENIPLWSITIWDKKFTGVEKNWQPKTIKYKYLLADELNSIKTKTGDVTILYTGKETGFTTEELAKDALSEGEIVSIPWGGIPTVKYFKGKFVTGDNRIATSSDTSLLLNKYLYFFMKSRIDLIASFYRGASLKHPSMKDVLELSISLPSIEEQKLIIEILEEIEKVLKYKEQELELLNNLKSAFFTELFGSQSDKTRWKRVTLNDVCQSIIRGPFGSSLKKEYFVKRGNNTFKVYEQKHAIQKSATIGTYYITAEKYNELKRFECLSGDIIMSCSGTMGELFQLPEGCEKGVINQALCKFTLNSDIHPSYFLEYMKQAIDDLDTKGSGIKNIGAVSYVKAMEIDLPPMEIQLKYATFVNQINKTKSLIQESIDKTQILFDSLMQEYFG